MNSGILALSIVSNFSLFNQTSGSTHLVPFNENQLRLLEVQNKVFLQYYYGATVYDFKTFNIQNGLDILKEPTFNNELKTIIYMHGYGENPAIHSSTDSIDTIVAEFLKRKYVNIVVVNYAELVWRRQGSINIEYIRAIKYLPHVGRVLGDFFSDFIAQCQCQQRMHIIGFSLGSQVAHYTSKGIQQRGAKLTRITGIEPARPFFEGFPFTENLEETDAIFVDVIHSDAGYLGWSSHVGHADFWPNKGVRIQPYCLTSTLLECSHYTSIYYYAVSINNPQLFPARKCQNGDSWSAGLCDKNDIVYFGYNTQFAQGDFFFSTSALYPYGKDVAGLTPNLYYYFLYTYY